jgi:hypothetical protein
MDANTPNRVRSGPESLLEVTSAPVVAIKGLKRPPRASNTWQAGRGCLERLPKGTNPSKVAGSPLENLLDRSNTPETQAQYPTEAANGIKPARSSL